MKRYRYGWDFYSATGQGDKGDVVELDEDVAAHINRESPGVLEEVVEKTAEPEPEDEPAARAVGAPPHDRMQRKGRTRMSDRDNVVTEEAEPAPTTTTTTTAAPAPEPEPEPATEDTDEGDATAE